MIGETGERKSAVATPDGKSRKKKKMQKIYGLETDDQQNGLLMQPNMEGISDNFGSDE